jgi:hypothetical protein
MIESTYPVIYPMKLGELLDKAIRLYRQNFLKFIGIYAIPYIPLFLIQIILSYFSTTEMFGQIDSAPEAFPFTPTAMVAMLGSFVAIFVQFILVQGFATAALTRAVANNYASRPIGILDSYRTLSTSGWRLVLALMLVFIFIVILFIWTLIPCVGWLSGPGILFFIGFVVNPLVAPVVSLEKLGVMASVRRAWDLARSRFWWLVGFALVLTLLGQLIVTGPVYLLNFILQTALSTLPGSIGQQIAISSIVQSLVTMSLTLLYMPLQLTILTVVYFDLRARSEGLDLALQISGTAETDKDVISLPDISSKEPKPLFEGIDVGRFALLSLVGIAFYALIFAVLFLVAGLVMAGF